MSVTYREIYSILSQYIQREEITNVARNREVIFITLVDRKAAQHIFDCLQGMYAPDLVFNATNFNVLFMFRTCY